MKEVPPNEKRCSAYDQISDRSCRYYANHGGKHHFTRLDHDCDQERELRRALDEMTAARDAACEIIENAFSDGHWHRERLAELRKVGAS